MHPVNPSMGAHSGLTTERVLAKGGAVLSQRGAVQGGKWRV